MFNDAKWITLSSLPCMVPSRMHMINGSVYFRKCFEIYGDVQKAELYICALGLGVYSINGCDVSDEVLCTPYTQYDRRFIYNKYDIKHLLKKGANAIGVHAGNGFYNDNMTVWNDIMANWKDNIKLIANIEITYETGEIQTVKTDLSWKGCEGPAVYNHMRQGEKYDARLKQEGYDTADFDDAKWENVVLTHEPGGIAEEAKMPPIRVVRTLKAKKYMNGIYDFGENISGWAKIKLSGENAQEVRLIYDECIDKDGAFLGNINQFAVIDKMPLLHEDVFICSGKEREVYRPSFTYHGFRYVRVINAPVDFEIEAEVVHTDLSCIGFFECSDMMLNKIHEASVKTTLSNYVGIPTDCPHREQNGWTGDAMLSSDQTLMNFDMKEAYKKWMLDFKDAQRPNGQLPGIIPTSGWGYNWGCGPSFDSAVIVIPHNVYINTGSTELIELMWDNMERYMKYFERMSINGIADFGLGDWKPVRKPSCPIEVIETAYFYGDCIAMAQMADATDRESDLWYKKAEKSKEIWRNAFWGREDLKQFQTFYACAIYFDLLNEDEIILAAKKLAQLVIDNDYHIDCGIRGTKYIFKALSENGYIDVLYKMVTNPTYPSYAYWINQGQTTLCESWDMSDSCNHHMYSEVDNWLYRYIGGIKYTVDGLVIQPVLVKGIDYVKAEHRGVSVVRNGNRVNISLPVAARIIIGDNNFNAEAGEYELFFSKK